MYISNTTQEQRRIIDCALDGMYCKVRRAHNLLGRVWDDYFGTANQEAISSSEAEYLGELIYTIDDIIWSAALEYALVVGDRDFPGVEPPCVVQRPPEKPWRSKNWIARYSILQEA